MSPLSSEPRRERFEHLGTDADPRDRRDRGDWADWVFEVDELGRIRDRAALDADLRDVGADLPGRETEQSGVGENQHQGVREWIVDTPVGWYVGFLSAYWITIGAAFQPTLKWEKGLVFALCIVWMAGAVALRERPGACRTRAGRVLVRIGMAMALTIAAGLDAVLTAPATPSIVLQQQPSKKPITHPAPPTWSGTHTWFGVAQDLRFPAVTGTDLWAFDKAGWVLIPTADLGGRIDAIPFRTRSKATALTAGEGFVAAEVNGHLAVRDATNGEHLAVAEKATGSGPLAIAGHAVLVGDRSDDKIYAFTLPGLRHYTRFAVPGRPNGIAAVGDSAWVSTAWSRSGPGYIGHLVGFADINRRPLPRGGRIVGYAAGLLWLSVGVSARSIALESWSVRTNQQVGHLTRLGEPVAGLTAIRGVVFVLERNSRIVALDPRTGRLLNQVALHQLGLLGVASARGSLVVTGSKSGKLADVIYRQGESRYGR